MVEVDPAQREARAREVRHEVVAQLTVGTHRAFRILFAAQWVIAVLLAWNVGLPGDGRLWVTLILGGMLCVPASLFTQGAPLAWWTRHWVAICQVGWSALFLWLFDGHSEAQFHLFVSLAFLAFYRDWTMLLTAMAVAITWPLLRMAMLPEAYTIGAAAWSRLANHAAYVIAETVMLPGDPLRAQFIAENYLEDARRVSDVRNMWGYTGTYHGKRLSVMATGMGIPSASIYCHELCAEYRVKRLIRVGSCGSVQPSVAQVAKHFNKPLDKSFSVPGLNNTIMPWHIASDGSVTNGITA